MQIGFIGAGQMARALASGLVRAGMVAGRDIAAADPVSSAREQFARQVADAQLSADNRAVVAESDVIVLAVKPQHANEVLREVNPVEPTRLIVSIVAGLPIRRLAEGLGSQRVVRVMPNTPCLAGCGASAFSCGPAASQEDSQLVTQLLASVGFVCEVPEPLLDAVTGLSGSGPAFVCVMIEALADGGVLMGLPRDTALRLAAQTVAGTARMIVQSGQHPAVLKDGVASPGGTTIAGLQELEQAGVRAGLMAAVEAAALRSQQLGQTE